ncbi:hypothetical protein CTI12_AA461460 [Artemisia annua]|uniref:Proton pump-interactor 1 n=1 Tax=Artemisia annua TaxID=35608 RepID=A0A2U1LRV2_ARTAN|nr:hypothetical protein CTI12_AA461460 [Artemisia annua]
MEEQTECDKKGKNIHCFYFVKIRPTHQEVEKEEAEKQYQLMNLARLRISEELDIQRGYAYDINKKLVWYWYSDERIESKMRQIRNLERYLGKVEPSLPIATAAKTNGFYRLPGKSDGSPVRPDQKRCQERLIKKGKMDKEYLQQVQEELLSSKKLKGMTSFGTQELNDLSMENRIQNGSKKRSDEIKIYNEIRNLKETKEDYTAPEPEPRPHYYWSRRWLKKDTDDKRSTQHQIDMLLDDIEKIKRDQIGRNARVTRLKAQLQPVMKNISCLKRELENANSKRLKAYKRAYELGEQKKEMNSIYDDYQSLMTQVEELVQKGDVVALKQACDTQVQGFMEHWSGSQAFRDDYEKRNRPGISIVNENVRYHQIDVGARSLFSVDA